MKSSEIKAIIKEELPQIIAQDSLMRDFILRTVSEYYSPKQETDNKFDRTLTQLERDREEQAIKWREQNQQNKDILAQLDRDREQQAIKWEENQQQWREQNQQNKDILAQLDRDREQQSIKWHEQNQQNKEILEEIKKLNKKHDSTIGALGSRWGLYSEASFRNGLKGILEDSFGVEVLNLNDFDDEGEVFGRPDQVEIDVIIKNGLVILCEIKSSIDKAGMYIFDRKVAFYQKRHQRMVNRKLIISPMIDQNALRVAEKLAIEVFSYADDVTNL